MNKISAEPLEVLSTFPNVFKNLNSSENQVMNIQDNFDNTEETPTSGSTLQQPITHHHKKPKPTSLPKDNITGTSYFTVYTYVIPIVLIILYSVFMVFGSDIIFSRWGFLTLIMTMSGINLGILGTTANNMPKIQKDIVPCVGDGGFGNINSGEYITVYAGIIAQTILLLIFVFFIILSKTFDTRKIYYLTYFLLTIIIIAILIVAGIFIKADRCNATEHLTNYNSVYAGALVFTMMFNLINYLYVAAACFSGEDNTILAISKLIFVYIPLVIIVLYPTYLGSLTTDDQRKTSSNTGIVGGIFGIGLFIFGILGIIMPGNSLINWGAD